MDLYFEDKKITTITANYKYTVGYIKTVIKDLLSPQGVKNYAVNFVLNDNTEIDPIVFNTTQYDNISFHLQEHLLDGSKILVSNLEIKSGIDKILSLYKIHLDKILTDGDCMERFKLLADCDSLGCFCEPGNKCHIDVIKVKLEQLKLKSPKRQCVKAKFLRNETNADNLEEWLNNTKNILCTRRGRIFIGSKKQNNHRIFHYQQSEWGNPYK